ncbi:Hpt domain-containing protein [Neptunitalea lumnitzerae]|uniref:Histidine kinase n=1 Tax=Neptunitalea lumnitzerae TaxID=2965509 RepID=A0ABQ5MFB0_9FLAO|nr:Hpt domain-containing protein [Neptunitalea sp. Y10]GLB48063.1 histidine kinase [Neptunitalea sp. Y10]
MELPNFSYIHSLSGGDKDFEQQLLKILKAEFPEEKEIYFKAVAEKNFSDAAEIVHKIKHKISILGLEKSYTLADTYENNLKMGETALQKEFQEVLQVMTDFLKEL